jgi:hypothetical protein
MPTHNPLSIPGGWKKETPKGTPHAEEPNPGMLTSHLNFPFSRSFFFCSLTSKGGQ